MSDQTAQTSFRHTFSADAEEARGALEAFRREEVIGLDTETFWDANAGGNRLSLLQLAREGGEVLVIDALAVGVETFRELIESEDVRMVAHNARFDDGVLGAAGLRPAALVDTLRMARMGLMLESYSLASVTEHLFGVPLDKTLRTSNWRRRPLTRAQVAYAAKDAHMVLLVYHELRRRFEAEGTFEGALRAALLGPPSAGREKRKRRIVEPLSPPLTAEEKLVVARLKKWRLALSNQQRVPAYMICPDKTLEHLARSRPATLDALKNVYGLGESKVTRFGGDLLEALKDACGDSTTTGG